MARSRVFKCEDGRASVHWRFGLLADRVELWVDGERVAERSVFGFAWPTPFTIDLEAMGYRALVHFRWDAGLAGVAYDCTFIAPIRANKQEAGSHGSSTDSVDTALRELGIESRIAGWEEIERAFRHLAKQYHPDRYTSMHLPPEMIDAAVKRFARLKQAYEYLKDAR